MLEWQTYETRRFDWRLKDGRFCARSRWCSIAVIISSPFFTTRGAKDGKTGCNGSGAGRACSAEEDFQLSANRNTGPSLSDFPFFSLCLTVLFFLGFFPMLRDRYRVLPAKGLGVGLAPRWQRGRSVGTGLSTMLFFVLVCCCPVVFIVEDATLAQLHVQLWPRQTPRRNNNMNFCIVLVCNVAVT